MAAIADECHDVVMPNPRTLIAWLVVGVSALSLVGCAPSGAVSPDGSWSSRMSALLNDPGGQGGGGGVLSRQSDTGSVTLGSVTGGSFDILAVCTGARTMHFTVRDPSPTDSRSANKVSLASSDIACGATLRIPVTITAGEVTLTVQSDQRTGQWHSAIVTPGWDPVPTTYVN